MADDLDTLVTNLFGACPSSGDNSVGQAARAALVNRLEGATPGTCSGLGKVTFLSKFFPKYSPDPNAGAVTPALGFDAWPGFATEILCQAMYYITKITRQHIRTDIDDVVSDTNAKLEPGLNAVYEQLLQTVQGPIAGALSAIPSGEWPLAAQRYTGFLLGPAWITEKVAQMASGQWPDQSWELFHHWVKLTILGMAAADVDALITQLTQAGLPVSQDVAPGRWETYLPWMRPSIIDWNDVKDSAQSGIMETLWLIGSDDDDEPYYEGNSQDFTSTKQPGKTMRK